MKILVRTQDIVHFYTRGKEMENNDNKNDKIESFVSAIFSLGLGFCIFFVYLKVVNLVTLSPDGQYLILFSSCIAILLWENWIKPNSNR